MKLRTILVEDSSDNLNVLRHFIEKDCPQLEVVGTAANIEEAEREIKSQQPDVVFFDIVLEDRNSFELLEKLESEDGISFLIVFVTAHSRFDFAEKAIDYSAVGYLTKPIDRKKLVATVGKAVRLHPLHSIKSIKKALDRLDSPKSEPPSIFKIAKVNQVIKTVSTDEVSHIVAEKDLSRVYLADGEEIQSTRPLGYYQQEMEDHPSFFRIHNSTLVNINQITELNKRDNIVFMRNGLRLNCSRRMGKALYEFFENGGDEKE